MRGRRLLLAGVGAGLAVLLLWWVTLWKPRQSSVSAAREQGRAAQQNADDLELRVRRLEDLKSGAATKQAQLESLRIAVPDKPNLAQFILDANELASKAGIDVLTITPGPPAGGGPVTAVAGGGVGAAAAGTPAAVKISLTVNGGYFQVVDFLNELNDLPRIVVTDSLSVTAGNDPSRLAVSLTARIFTTPAGAAAVAPSGPSSPTTTVPRGAAGLAAGAAAGATTVTSVP